MEMDEKLVDKKKVLILMFLAFLVLVMLLVTIGVAAYRSGVRSQAEIIKGLNSRLSVEQKETNKWWGKAMKIEADRQKLQSSLKEKSEEVTSWEKIATDQANSREACEKKLAALSKPQVKKSKRVAKKIASAKAAPAPPATPAVAPAEQAISVPAPAPATQKLILRINVVEWSPVFEGKSLKSRDIGPVVRQGLANGTVVRTKKTLTFLINNAFNASVQNGSAIVDLPIGPETALVIQPPDGAKFASPPNGLPLTTNPGELNSLVSRGISEVWLNFILAPPAPAAEKPPEKKKKNSGGPKGLPPFPLFL